MYVFYVTYDQMWPDSLGRGEGGGEDDDAGQGGQGGREHCWKVFLIVEHLFVLLNLTIGMC